MKIKFIRYLNQEKRPSRDNSNKTIDKNIPLVIKDQKLLTQINKKTANNK